MLYTILIADDNPVECDAAALILKKLPQTGSIITCEDGFQVQQALKKSKVDVVFSDIQMPGLDGLKMLRGLKDPPPFVFITSYSDFAAESFEVDALDFVVKPVTFERLSKAANKAFEYIELKKAARKNSFVEIDAPIGNSSLPDDYFFIRETKGITKLHYADVSYIESMGDFSKVFRSDGQTHIILSSLKSLEGQLPDMFKRIHKQYIVNLEHVQTIARAEVFLANTISIPLSGAFRQELMTAFVNKEPIKRT